MTKKKYKQIMSHLGAMDGPLALFADAYVASKQQLGNKATISSITHDLWMALARAEGAITNGKLNGQKIAQYLKKAQEDEPLIEGE